MESLLMGRKYARPAADATGIPGHEGGTPYS